MKSIRAAANPRRKNAKKSSGDSSKSKAKAARKRNPPTAEPSHTLDKDGFESVGTGGKRESRLDFQRRVKKMMPKIKVDPENIKKGETRCPDCKFKNKKSHGCKLMTCPMTSLHHDGKSLVHYCAYCKNVTKDGILRGCTTTCLNWFNLESRLEYCQFIHDVDDDEDTSTPPVSRDSKQSPSAFASYSDEIDSNGDSNETDLDNDMKTASESDLNEDEDVAKEVPTSSDSDVAARAIKQEPDTVASTAYDEDTVIDETVRPTEVKSADISVEVKAEVASSSTAPYAYDDDTDVEDSASSKEKDGEGDDVIYQESQRRKREAAEQEGQGAAAPKNTNINFDSSPVDQGGIIEAEFEAQTSGTRHSPPPLTLTGPTTTVTEDLGFIRHQWPRVARQRLSEELKQILLNLLKSYDTRAVASFIRTEVSENKQMRTKSPYNDDTFNAIFSRLENLKNSNKGKASSTRKASAATANRANNASQEKSNNARGGVPARGKRKSSEEEEEQSQSEVARKKYKYECPVDGCTNQVQNGGVCIKHGAEVKRCSSKGCTNGAIKGGVCKKHAVEQFKKQICMHGAKVKLCSSEGCTHYAFKGGVCVHCPPANLYANL